MCRRPRRRLCITESGQIYKYFMAVKNILPVAVSTTTVLVSLAKNTRKYNQSKETKKMTKEKKTNG